MKTILTTDEALTNILARILAHVSDFFKNPSHNCKNRFILLNNIHHENQSAYAYAFSDIATRCGWPKRDKASQGQIKGRGCL